MKKILILLITVIMTFGLVGCSKSYKDVFKSYLKETAKLNAMEREIYSKMATTDESEWISISIDCYTVLQYSFAIVHALRPLEDNSIEHVYYEGEIGNLCHKHISYMACLYNVRAGSDIENLMSSYIEYYNYLVESANKYGINLSDYGIVPIQWDTLK